jgi:uncharacterized protein YqhQ
VSSKKKKQHSGPSVVRSIKIFRKLKRGLRTIPYNVQRAEEDEDEEEEDDEEKEEKEEEEEEEVASDSNVSLKNSKEDRNIFLESISY